MLGKLKTLVKAILQYLMDNPVQRRILVACCVAIAAIIIALIVVGAVKKKKRKQKNATACACKQATEETAAEEIAPTEEVSAKDSAPNQEVSAEAKKTTTTKKASKPKKETLPKKKAETAVKATEEKKVLTKVEAKKTAPTKPTIEQAKEKQPTAKYTGKWVICMLLLTDSENNVVEENYFFELRASNGERLLVSEEYTSHAGALRGIQTHKDNIERGNFRITISKKGDYIFKLLTAKNTLLCTGANYKSLERCERAIASTKRFAATAVVQEEIEEIRMPAPTEDEAQTETHQPENGYEGKWIIDTKGNEQVGIMYYFELFASNGEKLLTSEEYTTFEGAVNAVATHKANIAKGNFRISVTKKGDYLFKLLGGNGQLLCIGEHYKTRSRCESAVESVKRFSQSAPVYKYGEINN